MKKANQKIILIVILITILINPYSKVFANSDSEELIILLNLYKSQLGNIEQFSNVVDAIYNDLNSATKVDDELKAKLNEDINMLAKVEGINPLILQVLDVELKNYVNGLNDENIEQMKQDILVIKNGLMLKMCKKVVEQEEQQVNHQ